MPRFLVAARRVALAGLVLAGCGPSTPAEMAEDLTFPSTFIFGSATAGFQVEAGCPTIDPAECEDRHSDWYHFVSDPGLQMNETLAIHGDPVSAAPGFYELYADDIKRAAEDMHHGGLRLSMEWSRVFPQPTFDAKTFDDMKRLANPKALAFYHKVFAELKKRGMRPLVTLHHYSLPDWMHDTVACNKEIETCQANGWVDEKRIVPEIAKWADFAGREFGGEVDLWATLNEPLSAVVLAGFIFPSKQRSNPPGTSLKTNEAKKAMVSMIVAHARMYDALKAADKLDADGDGQAARVGTVYNLQATGMDNPDEPLDQRAAKNAHYLMNEAFLNGVIKGDLDADLDGTPEHRDDLSGRMDYLGVNYYARIIVQGTPNAFFSQISPLTTFNLLTMSYDYADARGLYEVLKFGASYGLPLIITEVGVEDENDDGGPSSAGAWLVKTLTWTKRAMAEGVKVDGYFYWTLMDNYEWNHGMTWQMGLYGVDSKDPMKLRKPRKAVGVYGQIAEARGIPSELVAKYPVPR